MMELKLQEKIEIRILRDIISYALGANSIMWIVIDGIYDVIIRDIVYCACEKRKLRCLKKFYN